MEKKVNIRALALDLLLEYENLEKYLNLSLSSHKTDGLSVTERGLLTLLLYGTVESKITYDYYISALSARSIDKIDERTKNILRLGITQILKIDKIPDFAAVNESVNLAKNSGQRGFINGVLRAVIRNKDNLPLPDKDKNFARYLSVKYSVALWIVKKYITLFGEEETEKLLIHMNNVPPTDLTVNLAKISREDFCKKLTAEGYCVSVSDFSPISVRIEGSVDVTKIPGYDEGEFFVQDRASSTAAFILGARPGELLIDVAACPGGKTFASATLMEDKGEICAFDIHESKISLIEDGAARLGFKSVKASVSDATKPKEELFGRADRVICDTVCSGLGVIAKKPDMRYKEEGDVDSLPEIQYSILAFSAKYLKRGGRLLYSTCTVTKEENDMVVDRFLNEHKNFRAVDFNVGEYKSENGRFMFIPHIHNTDGFFVSLIEREE